jgi:ATP-dependent Lon protease
MEKTQREYYLNEQLKAIQSELGGGDDGHANEIQELQDKIDSLKLSKDARAKAQAELKKLKTMQPMSAEATVIRNYLDVLLGLPWGKRSKLKKDIGSAQTILDADHYALDKVKDRIVEYLAVQARTNKLKGPILCLVGPPGVGKTSLGKSIAKATGRQFIRQSLGGVRDEAEIRGHRRTYIGSLPGKIVTNLRKAGTMNPLFLLDEIDKLGQDFRGDPASALLEVLDPEQNAKFQDHYLELDVDLSDVMFVCTANSLNLPQPLLDRMEIIRLEGYTEDEKVEIAERHLVRKQIEAHGLKVDEFTLTQPALRDLIRYYTREAGAHAGARNRPAGAQVAAPHLGRQGQGDHDHAGKPRRLCRCPEIPSRRFRRREPGRRSHRSGLDRSGRRTADDRKRHGSGQGRGEDHRQAGRSDERERPDGVQLRQGAQPGLWDQAFDLPAQGPAHPLARRRRSQGWPECGHRHGHRHGVDADRHPGACRCGDDRRSHAARSRAGDRRAEGKAARGSARRDQDRPHPRGEPQGSGRDPGQHRQGLEIIPVSHVDEVLARALVSRPEPIEWTEADDSPVKPVAPVQTGITPPTAH